MTTLSEVKGRKVVSLESGLTVGQVADIVIDPAESAIVALVLRKTAGDGDVLPWADLSAFGVDAVTVADEGRVVVPDDRIAELAAKVHELAGKRVLNDHGEELGSVADIEFDPATGAVIALHAGAPEPIAGDRLVASGSYAVIVTS